MTEGNRRKRIVYRNTHRQSNSSYMGDERRLNLLIVDLEKREKEIELQLKGFLDKFANSDCQLAKDFRSKKKELYLILDKKKELEEVRDSYIVKQQVKNIKDGD